MDSPLPPHLQAAMDRIDAALEAAFNEPLPTTGTLSVCEATEEEWTDAYCWIDGNAVSPRYLEWFDNTGIIHIVEFECGAHSRYAAELGTQFYEPHIHRWLRGWGSAVNEEGRRACPDVSYAASRSTPGCVLTRSNACTIKIEIGVSQAWGMDRGQLDHKAIDIWGQTNTRCGVCDLCQI